MRAGSVENFVTTTHCFVWNTMCVLIDLLVPHFKECVCSTLFPLFHNSNTCVFREALFHIVGVVEGVSTIVTTAGVIVLTL